MSELNDVGNSPTASTAYEYQSPGDIAGSLVDGLNNDALDTPGSLTADSLLIYLQSRLGYLDTRVNEIFGKQKKLQHIHDELMGIQTELDRLDEENGGTDSDYQARIEAHIDEIEKVDPDLAQKMRADLEQEGQVLHTSGSDYTANDVKASSEYVSDTMKKLESNAQLEMIELQSLMSTRQTAIQLATNMVSSIGQGPQAIANNIGK
jgi:hypothetical protein